MTAADTALVPSGTAKVPTETERLTLPPRRSARERRIAAAVGGLALVGATTSMAMAAQDALPGEALYPVKRAMENAQTGLQLDEGDKGATLLANASGRLDEVSALSESASGEDTDRRSRTPSTRSPTRPPRPPTCCSRTTRTTATRPRSPSCVTSPRTASTS